jgi:hypothetical protein
VHSGRVEQIGWQAGFCKQGRAGIQAGRAEQAGRKALLCRQAGMKCTTCMQACQSRVRGRHDREGSQAGRNAIQIMKAGKQAGRA